MSKWLEKEYNKCRQFCNKYQEYKKITNLMKYDKNLKSRQTQLKYELLGILENIIEDDWKNKNKTKKQWNVSLFNNVYGERRSIINR